MVRSAAVCARRAYMSYSSRQGRLARLLAAAVRCVRDMFVPPVRRHTIDTTTPPPPPRACVTGHRPSSLLPHPIRPPVAAAAAAAAVAGRTQKRSRADIYNRRKKATGFDARITVSPPAATVFGRTRASLSTPTTTTTTTVGCYESVSTLSLIHI